MIKQDYLLRMIQEIISLIANAILNKKKIRQQEWVEYDCLTGQIAMTLLKMSDETDADHLLQKSKLRQEGMELLKYVQKAGNTFSIQRVALIHLLEMNG
jgi:hypothetical protein